MKPSPALAALLSFIFPGLGQIYAGNIRKGLLWALPMLLFIVAVIWLLLGGQTAILNLGFDPQKRLALLVLVVGVATVVAFWSRGRPVDVEVIYDFGRHAPRVVQVELSYDRQGKGAQPVELDFPSAKGAPKRWRHTLSLVPGEYTVRARVHLRGVGDQQAEVRRYSRHLTVRSGEEQRIVLRLAR